MLEESEKNHGICRNEFHCKMTQLVEETVIFASDYRFDALIIPGKCGLLHYSSRGSAGTGAGAYG
jgi:hypothetical protein